MHDDHNKLIRISATVALIGFLCSGPLSFLLVRFIKPQPDWVSAEVFAGHYHFIQDIPFYLGFFLVGGMLMMSVTHYVGRRTVKTSVEFYLLLSVSASIVFSAMIVFNYVCQVVLVRQLSLHYTPANDNFIEHLSMSNPASLGWAIEMWGYAFLGISNMLMSVYYRNKNKTVQYLLIANGVVSIVTALATSIDMGWVLGPAGVGAYFLWNALMITINFLIYRHAQAPRS